MWLRTIVSVVLVLLALVVWFFFEGMPVLTGVYPAWLNLSLVQSGIILYQNRQEFRRLKYRTSHRFISLYIRSIIFTIGMLIGTG